MSEKVRKVQYHYGFYAIVHGDYMSEFTFLQEQEIGFGPIRLDVLLIAREGRGVATDPIGRFFKRHNILEYKSPDDALSIDDFYMAQSYACGYKGKSDHVDEINGGELTLSIFRTVYPREMFLALEKLGHRTENVYPGIYHVPGLLVPVQVIVISQLPEGEYSAFKILARDAKEDDVVRFLETADERYKPDDVSAILRVSMATNEELYRRLKEEGRMGGAVARIFREELAEARGEARAEERRDIRDILIAGGMKPQELQERLTAGGMSKQEAASFAGVSI